MSCPSSTRRTVSGSCTRASARRFATSRYEVVYVDDGSTDCSAALVETLGEETGTAVLVKLSRNFGMEVAMSAGLDHARGDYVVLMHADLQDPPELMPDMLRIARDGADVVYARRIGRDESLAQARCSRRPSTS